MPELWARRDFGSLFGPPTFSHNTRPAFNSTRLLEPVSDYQAPPTPLFPRKREGEVCSFLRHSVRLLAEGVAGPARICNAGTGLLGHKSGVAWQRRTGGRSRVTQPCLHCHRAPTRDAPTDAWGLTPFEGRVSGPRGRSLAWARVARMCVCFKRAGENAGLGRISGKKWCRRGEEVGRVWGWMRQGWERVARQGDTFFGFEGANGSGLGEVVRPGCALGRPGDIG